MQRLVYGVRYAGRFQIFTSKRHAQKMQVHIQRDYPDAKLAVLWEHDNVADFPLDEIVGRLGAHWYTTRCR